MCVWMSIPPDKIQQSEASKLTMRLSPVDRGASTMRSPQIQTSEEMELSALASERERSEVNVEDANRDANEGSTRVPS